MSLLKRFVTVGNDKEKYNQLLEHLQQIVAQNQVDLGQVEDLKNQINVLRRKNGLAIFSPPKTPMTLSYRLPESKDGDLPELKLPGDKPCAQSKHVCKNCGATLAEDAQVCTNPNCKSTQSVKTGPYQAKPTPKGKQYNPYSRNTPVFIPHSTALLNRAASKKHHKDDAEEDSDVVTDVYQSESFDQCINPKLFKKRKMRNNVDKKTEEVWNSCRDLEIDG